MVTKQEKLILMFLLFGLTFGVFAMVYNNKLLGSGSTPREIHHTVVFQADANSGVLRHSSGSETIHSGAAVEKSKESSQILVNINEVGKGELIKLPSIKSLASERIMYYRNDFGGFNTI